MPYLESLSKLTERFPRQEDLCTGLTDFISGFYHRLNQKTDQDLNPEWKQFVETRIMSIIDRNNEVAIAIMDTSFRQGVLQEQDLKGECVLGMSICIDGRLPIMHIAGLTASVWEVKAGILPVRTDFAGDLALSSGILTTSVTQPATQGTPLLDILFAHTGKEHSCGAMLERQQRGMVRYHDDDLVAENLQQHDVTAEIIKDHYNRAATAAGTATLERVAIPAVYDTDYMGMRFGHRQPDLTIVTTDLVRNNLTLISNTLENIYGTAYSKPGAWQTLFQEADNLSAFHTNIRKVMSALMTRPQFTPFVSEVSDKLELMYPDLNLDQRRALFFLISRTVGFQYLTGAFEDNMEHPFKHHAEKYMAISRDGKTVGQFDPEVQVFGASVADAAQGIDHINTQMQLMDSNNHVEKPFILFVSSSVSQSQSEASLRKARGRNKEFFDDIVIDKTIQMNIITGELVVVPVLIDEVTLEVLEVVNYSL